MNAGIFLLNLLYGRDVPTEVLCQRPPQRRVGRAGLGCCWYGQRVVPQFCIGKFSRGEKVYVRWVVWIRVFEEANDAIFVLDFTHHHDPLVVIVRRLEGITRRRQRAVGVELECAGEGWTGFVVDAEGGPVETQEREEPSNGEADFFPDVHVHFHNHPDNARKGQNEYGEEDVQEEGVRAELWIHMAVG